MDGIMADIRDSKGDCFSLAEVAHIASKFNVPMFYIRKPKKHGLKRNIEGDLDVLKKCKDVLLVSKYKPSSNPTTIFKYRKSEVRLNSSHD